ncbi:MAG: alpha-beta hydrolase superfamily lysophospholipase [Paraglaciecola sp.]|jgi:alpha-beta hydrolase superfamily lysophospholipase
MLIEKQITARDGHKIDVYIWQNEHPKAWVHINHGMAEHALRYNDFAHQLVESGYAVVAHNHRGHGSSATTKLGCFNGEDNWQNILTDLECVRDAFCSNELPYYLFGHSMGSFIVQSFLSSNHRHVDGLILSASNLQQTGLSQAGRFVAKIEKMRLGKDSCSPLLQKLSFGSFNKAFKPNRTEYDWLSRDTSQVDKYIADPLCGFPCSTGFWEKFLTSLVDLFSEGSLEEIQHNLPILMLGGSQDPVGMMGKGLPKLADAYKKVGQTNVTLKLYESGRHEMLNETNHQQVGSDIIDWLSRLKD